LTRNRLACYTRVVLEDDPDAEIFAGCFERAKKKGVLDAVWEAVEGQLGQPQKAIRKIKALRATTIRYSSRVKREGHSETAFSQSAAKYYPALKKLAGSCA
jgi:hypothetical protein